MSLTRELIIMEYEMMIIEAVKAGKLSAMEGIRAIDRMHARYETVTEYVH